MSEVAQVGEKVTTPDGQEICTLVMPLGGNRLSTDAFSNWRVPPPIYAQLLDTIPWLDVRHGYPLIHLERGWVRLF